MWSQITLLSETRLRVKYVRGVPGVANQLVTVWSRRANAGHLGVSIRLSRSNLRYYLKDDLSEVRMGEERSEARASNLFG